MSIVINLGLPKTGTVSMKEAMNKLGFKIVNPRRWDIIKYKKLLKDNSYISSDLARMLPFKEINENFDVKFIQTIRNEKDWYNSIANTHNRSNHTTSIRNLILFWEVNPQDNKDLFIPRYNKLNKKVIKYFKDKDNFIQMDLNKDGWNKLCNFLELPIPDIPFPNENRAKNKKTRLDFYKC
jgi:hypothetical protein